MKFGLSLRSSEPLPIFVDNIRLMETEGFDSVGIAEYGRYRDIVAAATLAALNTRSIRIGLFCIPYIRHPVVIASAVATVDEASGGRSFVVLGLGGYSCLKPLGMKIWERPLATLRETVKIIKGLYSGGSVEFDGEMFSPKGVKLEFAARKDIPVYIACMAGGRVLQLAGEVADGVLLAGPYGKYTKDIIEEVRKSADRNGRDPKILEIIMNTLLWCSTDGKKAIDEIKPFIAQEIVLDPRLHRAVEAEDVDVEKVRQAIQKGESGADLITDEVADAFAVVGDSDHCIERIKELGELGVAQINFWFPWTLAKYQTVTDRMKLVGKYIIPAFK